MGIQMGVGFGPGGAGIAAQAMQNQALEKKKKLDAEAKDRVSKISQLVTAVVMQGGKIGIDPMLNIQSGEPTGDANLDKMLPIVRDELSKLSPYEQELAKKTGYAVAKTVGEKFIAEQKEQGAAMDRTVKLAGQYNQFTPFPGEMPSTLGQAPQTSPGMLEAMSKLPPNVVGSQWMPNYPQGGETLPGAASVLTYGVNPPPQPPGTQTFYERDPEAWRQQQETQAQIGVKYRQPTAPEKPLRQLTQDAEGNWIEVKGGMTTPTKPDYTPKQAMTRISTIDTAIANIKTTGTIDIEMAKRFPSLALLVDTKDPEAVKRAIQSLKDERAEVLKFAPKGYGGVQKITPIPKSTGTKKKLLGTKNGKPVYDLGNGQWQIGD